MATILDNMEQSDAFVFGTPNHMRTITAALLNFLTRMLPLLVFKTLYDKEGNRIGGEISSRIQNKKAAMVISQGEPYFCSTLVHEVLERNLEDFKLTRAGNVISMGNLEKGQVAKRERDLRIAFELGIQTAIIAKQL
jgi:multimeric flavodoxin WrbA